MSQATRPTHVNPETPPARRPLRHVACCLAYVPLVLWATWPLARDGATHVVDAFQGGVRWLSLADVLFVVWSLAWDTHALATAPASLLDGNIFYPARWALARSDTFLGHLPFFAPLYLATGNPVLAHNLTLLAYLVLAAVTMYALAWRWTGRIGPALVAGALFGLAPWRLMVPYVQTQAVCHLPLVLLAGEYVLDGGPRPVAAALGGVLVLAGLSDLYVGILSFAVAAVLLAVRLRREPIAPRAARRFVGAVVTAGVLLGPAYLPQFLLARRGLLVPPSGDVQESVSAWPFRSYLTPLTFAGGTFLSLTMAALAALGLGLPRGIARLRTRRAILAWVGVLGYVLSLGPVLKLDGWRVPLPFRLLLAIPGLSSLRGAGRFGILVSLAASGLAAFGLRGLEERAPRAFRPALAAVALLGLVLEIGVHPFPLAVLETGDAVPPVYRWVAAAPAGPVLELPVGNGDADLVGAYWQARYAYMSTYHWRPLLNGYSGYLPPGFSLLMDVARRLPDRAALQDLVDLTGVRWLIVHQGLLPPVARAAWDAPVPAPGVVAAARFGDDIVFAVRVLPARDAIAALRAERPGPRTLGGASRAPLSPDALHARLSDLGAPPRAATGAPFPVSVTVENLGSDTWPGLDPFPAGLVAVRYRWAAQASDVWGAADSFRLARDLGPGERVRASAIIMAPVEPGRYRLELSLGQNGGPNFDGARAETTVDVVRWQPGQARRSLFE